MTPMLGDISIPGVSQVISLISGLFSKGATQDAAINAQNAIGQQFASWLNVLNSYKANGTLTVALINQFIQNVQAADQQFTNYCYQVGTSRAKQGAADIHNLAVQLIADRQAEAANLGSTAPLMPPYTSPVYTPPVSGTTGPTYTSTTPPPVYSAGIGGSLTGNNTILYLGLGILAVLLMSKK